MTTNTINAPYSATIHEGQPVFTLDNKRLGQVKEMTDTHFKVDVRFRRDYWIARDQVAFVDDEVVGLLFRSDESELYKLPTASDDGFQRRFERKEALGPEALKDTNFRDRFPLS